MSSVISMCSGVLGGGGGFHDVYREVLQYVFYIVSMQWYTLQCVRAEMHGVNRRYISISHTLSACGGVLQGGDVQIGGV